MGRVSPLCVIAAISMLVATVCCISALVATWWSGIAQDATLWKYRVQLVLGYERFSWDVVCQGMSAIESVDGACNMLNSLRTCVAVATAFAIISFGTTTSLVTCRSRNAFSFSFVSALAVWSAVLSCLAAAGALALGYYMLDELPTKSPDAGFYLSGFASIASLVATLMHLCLRSCCCCAHRKRPSDTSSITATDVQASAQDWSHPQYQWQQQPPMYPAHQWQQQNSWPSAPYQGACLQQYRPSQFFQIRLGSALYAQAPRPVPSYGQHCPQQCAMSI
eukprot:TRINITY_DN6553_c0_g1_i1.p2 TRINITY_DN6553_c0_g1~~TRINITY_DN6553_c0_g1_i1.p2  ORF type:complete len:278 (+),score=21.32 TRINITY_DN6553_c0_g1_i1:76-909(+)